jgi:hypothetical protein
MQIYIQETLVLSKNKTVYRKFSGFQLKTIVTVTNKPTKQYTAVCSKIRNTVNHLFIRSYDPCEQNISMFQNVFESNSLLPIV